MSNMPDTIPADPWPVGISTDCPRWCGGTRWHDPEQLDEPTVQHGRPITGGFLPEVRRIPGVVHSAGVR